MPIRPKGWKRKLKTALNKLRVPKDVKVVLYQIAVEIDDAYKATIKELEMGQRRPPVPKRRRTPVQRHVRKP